MNTITKSILDHNGYNYSVTIDILTGEHTHLITKDGAEVTMPDSFNDMDSDRVYDNSVVINFLDNIDNE